MITNPVTPVTYEDPLHIPVALQVQLKPITDGGYRIETQRSSDAFPLEVAYWYPGGFNDIMQGERGSLNATIQALVNFTIKGA